MNTSVLKKLATTARRTLRAQFSARAEQLGLGNPKTRLTTGGVIVGEHVVNVEHTTYTTLQKHLREIETQHGSLAAALVALVDEVAYTWFNRFTALRFLEANGYHRRTLSSSSDTSADPDALRDAYDLASSGAYPHIGIQDLERERRAAELNNRPPDGAVYRLALIGESRALRNSLMCLFDGKPYLELFLPDTLLIADSVTRALASIPDEDWKDIEIIGWLYQFYNSEEKDRVMRSKGKYRAQDIPAATQLFTPHWIVRYLVENSLGRTWLEAHPESNLRAHMPYYLEPHADNPKPTSNPNLEPQALTLLDPACGSGHILVYAFDLLTEIYLECGYNTLDIPELILTHNLHGLDIDPRAAQLAAFAVLMKARALNPRILRAPPKLHITAVKSTKHLTLEYAAAHTEIGIRAADWQPLLEAFRDADTLGSLVSPPPFDAAMLETQINALETSGSLFSSDADELRDVLNQARLLERRYAVVVANPPYMGSGSFDDTLKKFVERHYPRGKSDLFAVFMECCLKLTQAEGRVAMVNQHSWMFLSSYEALRKHLLETTFIQSMAHLGARAFPEIGGEVVQSTAFVTQNRLSETGEQGDYLRLVDAGNSSEKSAALLEAAKNSKCGYRFSVDARDFEKIPGSPIGYWISQRFLKSFAENIELEEVAFAAGKNVTANNDQFVRLLWEVEFKKIGQRFDWQLYAKGGEYRKWSGNIEAVVDRSNEAICYYVSNPSSSLIKKEFWHKIGITWSKITSNVSSFRLLENTFTFDTCGLAIFPRDENQVYSIIGCLNAKPAELIFQTLNPSITTNIEDVLSIPFPNQVDDSCLQTYIQTCINLSRADWDNFETSWDFQTHPLLRTNHTLVSNAFADWEAQSEAAFRELQRLEEENNRYWIAAYGLGDELTPEVPDDQITIRRADLSRDVRSLVSYAVGCLMGRYSLDAPGLIFAGGDWDASKYSRFAPDADGILPITDVAYFEDDLTLRFVAVVREVFGTATLDANLEFIADALGRGAGESALEGIRGYFLNGFSRDHHRVYKKRPIYWRFSSGKRGAFNALVYLHRITPDTLSRLRTKYVLPLLGKLQHALEAEEVLERGGGAAGRRAAARAKKLLAQLKELRLYQDVLQHKADERLQIDLDDGVAYNYTLFEGLVYDGPDLKLEDLRKRSQWKHDLIALGGGAS
jgi:N-6 DNA Methylase